MGSEPTLVSRIADELAREGLLVVDREADAIVASLAPHEHVPRLAGIAQPVLWLPGLHALGSRELDAALAARPRGWIITPMRTGEALARPAARPAREWLRQQGGRRAARCRREHAAGRDGARRGARARRLLHSRRYLLELLEHGLENVVPWARIRAWRSGGPAYRLKGSWVGELRGGRVDWQWLPSRLEGSAGSARGARRDDRSGVHVPRHARALHQPQVHPSRGELDRGVEMQLSHQVGAVLLHRLGAEVEVGRRRAVGAALGNQQKIVRSRLDSISQGWCRAPSRVEHPFPAAGWPDPGR